MEAVRVESLKNEIPDLSHSFEADKVKKCLTSQENITKQSSASSDETNPKEDALELLTECFSSDNKENIAKSNVIINEESNACAAIPLSYSFLTCEKKLLESSDDEEKNSAVEKFSKETGKLLQIPKKLKFLNDTISTPPSALREQISILRTEMKEAYEFHDLEIEILKGEKKEDPENYTELIEKYSTLLELYTSLKNEYEEYRKNQEKVRDELQSKTVDCLESLCSQIEASDNSLSNASIVSFNTDFKSSTMIGTFIEEETTLLHDVTIQTKDPLSDTDVFKTPKLTPMESTKKLHPRILIPKQDNYDSELNVKLMEVENAFHNKEKEMKELEQRLFQIEDRSGILQIEFEKISTGILNENENLKKSLLNKTEELDALIQKLFTEIVSLNPSLAESLTDSPGAKLLAVFIETIMERCKNMQDKLIMKFNTEKSLWETKMNSLEEENKNLNEQIVRQTSAFEEMKNACERQILENGSLKDEVQKLKSYEFNMKKIEEDLELAKEEITKLESCIKEAEDRCRSFEKTNHNIRLDLEELKNLYEVSQNENCELLEQLSEMREETGKREELCKQLKQELSEKEDLISARDEEILNLKNKEIKQVKAELAEASEMVLKLKAELFTTEGEKLKFEKRCSELEDTNLGLQTVISTKDIILKNLESFKSSCENEWENMKQEIKEKETIISSLKAELDTVNNKYCMEVKKVESLDDEISQKNLALEELRNLYDNIEKTLLNKDEEIQFLSAQNSDYRQVQDELASAKKTIEMLKVELVAAEDDKKKLKDECQVLEEKITNLCLDLEEIKSSHKKIEIENVNLENMIYKSDAKFKLESVFEILQEGKKALRAALSSKVQTENVAFELIAEQIPSSPEIVKLIENIVEYFNIEWEAKQNVIIENFKNEIKISSERVSQISAENANLQEMYEKVNERLKETESVISFRDEEILKLKNETALLEEIKTNLLIANEKILELENELDLMKSEKLKYEKLCREQEDINSTLQITIATKEDILRELEDFKHSCEIEQEELKRQITTNEDIITNLKKENEKISEEIKKSLLDDISSSLQISCEKLKDILGSEKYLNSHMNDLLKLLEQSESPYTETENRILTQFISAITDVRSKLLQEWDEQKNHNATLIRELENEVSDGKQREEEFRKLRFELEDAKAILETEITTKDSVLKDLEDFKSAHAVECVKFKQEIEEKEVLISKLKIELRVVEETYREKTNKIEKEKIESESKCLELEDLNSNLRSAVTSKDAILKELQDFKLYYERDLRDVKEQLQEREVTVRNLKSELESVKEEFSENLTKLNEEKINLEKRCSELEEGIVNLQSALTAKDIVLKDLENLKNLHVDECDRLKHRVEVKEEIISKLEVELVSVKNKWSEEVKKLEDEKVEFEHRYMELEGKTADLISSMAAKEKLLKNLEEFTSLHGEECEIIRQEVKEKEEIISKLKAELDAVKEQLSEEVKKSNADNILSGLKVNCEKLKDILGSEEYLNLGREDLLKLLERRKSPDTETEARMFTELFSAVFDVRSKLLQEWEVQKNNDVRLVKELKSEILELRRRREAAFDNVKQGRDRGDGKTFHEDDSVHDLAGLEKLKLSSVKDFPKVMTKIMVHVKKIQSRSAELKEENEKLDEECDSYAKVIKDLKKEAAVEWKKNNEKMLSLEAEIQRLTEVKKVLDNEKRELVGKISKLEEECQRLKTNVVPEGSGRNCGCGVDLKKVNELKRTILVKEQKLMELQELKAQNAAHKSQIEYLKNALDKERKKINEERERNKKLENEIKGVGKKQKGERKDLEEKEILEELRMRGSISGGVVEEIVDKEKMRKLSKDVGVLKEICRARYAEIKRLEAENAALKKITTRKNSNQMDSPIRNTGYSPGTRSKSFLIEKWKTEMEAKENRPL